uniref:Cytochrome c oxidase polypeptide VIa n=1 Tax=Ciona savignyi TaxID=51511 RepID=H2ZJ84_CIOSA
MSFILRSHLARFALKNVRQASGVSMESAEKTMKLMRVLSLTVVPFSIIAVGINAYMIEQEHSKHAPPPYKDYAHISICTKRFPWGDGKHTLFHNPKSQGIRGKGYDLK